MRKLMLVAGVLATAGCGGEMQESMAATAPVKAIADVSPAEWQRLAERRLFFGHQSVGNNIMAGVADVLAANPQIPLRVIQTNDPSLMTAPGLYHAEVGKNFEPDTKLAEFAKVAPAGVGDGGIAMLKYCYVDVDGDTDAAALFAEYRKTVDALRRDHPGLTIVHVTLPLQLDRGEFFHWRTVIRGQVTPYRKLNAIRQQYNRLLREAYSGKEPIFDLAHIESITSEGTLATARYKGERVPFLAEEWTYDGGHLNEAGRRRVAEALLVTLATL